MKLKITVSVELSGVMLLFDFRRKIMGHKASGLPKYLSGLTIVIIAIYGVSVLKER
ncbi:MAG: hypothetical protein KAH23_09720 [Kiritimatiellae bacterium]|nr:hypothetical protein [Kiritimatiellia bacterium]